MTVTVHEKRAALEKELAEASAQAELWWEQLIRLEKEQKEIIAAWAPFHRRAQEAKIALAMFEGVE